MPSFSRLADRNALRPAAKIEVFPLGIQHFTLSGTREDQHRHCPTSASVMQAFTGNTPWLVTMAKVNG